jgi:uncharacterized membrane protein
MSTQLAFFPIFGKPLIIYGGLLTLIFLFITAFLPYLGKKGVVKNHFFWHRVMAISTVCLALVHTIIGILAFI